MADNGATAGPGEEADSGALSAALLRLILIASFGPLLLNLSTTTVNVATEELMLTFKAPLSTVQWVVTGYLLALTLVLPSFRWMVERVGSRRLYVACLLAFTATSALSAFAWSAESLVAFRAVQGAVGGLLTPLTQALIAQLAGPKRMGRAIAIVSIPVLASPLLGPVLGGLLIQRLSWRWLFLFNAPLGFIGAWLAVRRLPPGTTETRTPFDVVGFLTLSPAVGLFTYAVSRLGRARTLSAASFVPLGVSLALMILFVMTARRRPESALIDLRLFRTPAVGAALVVYLFTSFASFGAQLLLPLYFQQVRGESAIGAGLLMAPQGLGLLCTLPQVGRLTDRFEHGKVVIAGALTTFLATIPFAQATEDTSYVLLCTALVVRGAGLGATLTPAVAAAYKSLAREDIPNATTAINIVQRVGAPVGTAAMAMMLQRFAAGIDGARGPLARAFAHTFAVCAALSGLALLSGILLVRVHSASPRGRSDPARSG